MKKISISSILLVIMIGLLFSFHCAPEQECADDDQVSSSDETIIKSRITNLASVINQNGVSADQLANFLLNFHDDSNYKSSYIQDSLDGISSPGPDTKNDYVYSDYSMCHTGNDVEVSCTASITNQGIAVDQETEFLLRKDGANWLIMTWKEDGTTMFEKKK